jgi:hypothetical protein
MGGSIVADKPSTRGGTMNEPSGTPEPAALGDNPDLTDQQREIWEMVKDIPGVRVDEDGRLLGPVAAAGRICVTEESPQGVKISTYRKMISGKLQAPGPLPLRNQLTGKQEFDLVAVQDWHNGRGMLGAWWDDITHRTAYRMRVLTAAAAGQLAVAIDPESLKVAITHSGEPFEGRANARAFSDLNRGGMLAVPTTAGPVGLTDKGRELLAQWRAEEREAAAATAAHV